MIIEYMRLIMQSFGSLEWKVLRRLYMVRLNTANRCHFSNVVARAVKIHEMESLKSPISRQPMFFEPND